MASLRIDRIPFENWIWEIESQKHKPWNAVSVHRSRAAIGVGMRLGYKNTLSVDECYAIVPFVLPGANQK